jgi:hypothetical protein
MTVAELIEKLRELPPDARAYTMDHDGTPVDVQPEYCDWGEADHPDRGVYL